jgi:LacI family transcriptional regulator
VNDIVAYACAQALKEAGRTIPGDVSLVGFDDLPSNAYMEPQLTSVKVSKRNIGRRAIQLMMDRIEHPRRPFEKVLVGGELVVRSSVRKYRTEGVE